ncbi:hypothetical protein HMPREF3182_00063 [Megasphaera hutchinsoni]|uniref:Uncharacterized protein n=1 Tax=Megasphaera hutchinsoni TaxID=1588748 RepID=A0A134CLP9_9FIRM|nr:hypothetical protein HMPREF3182_00063 [Megasphaera hutchinsoni]
MRNLGAKEHSCLECSFWFLVISLFLLFLCSCYLFVVSHYLFEVFLLF